jgi:hypothetical protein
MTAVQEILPARGIRPLRGTRPEVAGVLVRARTVVGIVIPISAGGPAGRATEVVILRGSPGLGLLATGADALTGEFTLETRAEKRPPVEEAAGVVRCAAGAFTLLDPERLRRRLGASPPSPGDRDGEQDPAGR